MKTKQQRIIESETTLHTHKNIVIDTHRQRQRQRESQRGREGERTGREGDKKEANHRVGGAATAPSQQLLITSLNRVSFLFFASFPSLLLICIFIMSYGICVLFFFPDLKIYI